MFGVLRHRAFRWIWIGALVSNVGNWMEAVAQSWLVQQQTASPFMVELLAAAEFVPHAILMLAAGWLADHYDRRKLLLAGQVAMMALGAARARSPADHRWDLRFSLLTAPVQGLLPAMADQVLHVGARGYGVLLSCLGAGAIAGALTLARLPRSYPRHHLIPISMLGFALCALIYGSSRWPLLSAAALAIGGVFWVWSLASSSTAMQLLVPEASRGRAMSVLALATTGPLPLGHLLGGAVASAFGIRAGVLVSCGALAAFSAWSAAVREPAIDAMELPPPPPRGFRAALWEALTAASHRAQVGEPRAAEPLEDA